MKPDPIMDHPSCGGVLEAFACLVRQGCPVLFERCAPALRPGRRDKKPPRHPHPEGHEARRLCERAR
jgi:hypothetical protein